MATTYNSDIYTYADIDLEYNGELNSSSSSSNSSSSSSYSSSSSSTFAHRFLPYGKSWEIYFYDSVLDKWVEDSRIPRAGQEPFSRTKNTTMNFVDLADGSISKLLSEQNANWQELVLVFPKKSINEYTKNQFLSYIDDCVGVKIPIPIKTGASLYEEKVLEGYFTRYEETWSLISRDLQEFVVKITFHEFDVDGDGYP